MRDYLSALKSLDPEKGVPSYPTELTKAPSVGFVGSNGTPFRPSQPPRQVSSDNSLGAKDFRSLFDEDDYEERAAILEHEAGWPRRWAEYFARLILADPPRDFSPVRWQQALDGALIFADEWAAKAIALGWEPQDVFGLHPDRPAARLDCRGLAWLLGDGARVVALDEAGAIIRTATGGRQTFHRRGGETAIW